MVMKMTQKGTEQEYVDIVVDIELPGVIPEMIDWWFLNMVDPRFYKLWHPWDHVSIEWEVPPTPKMAKNRNIGAIHIAMEKIGGPPVRRLRIMVIDPDTSPIKATYSHRRATCNLGPDDKPVGWILHEYEAAPYGTRMRSTFRWPASMTKKAIEALRKHNKGEMAQLPVFLPELYKLALIWKGVGEMF
jgi:hypothetical protein